MKSTILSIRVNSKEKEEFERVCRKNLMTMSDCVNVFIKDVLKKGKLPFEISLDNFCDIEKEKD